MPKGTRSANWMNLMTLTLLTAFFCKGTEGNGIDGFTLTAPASLTVPRGRCLLVPCQFTYRSDSSSPNENFFAYWFKDKEGPKYCFRDALFSLCVPGLLVATNDDAELVERSAVDRFYLVGNANKGNCSLLITDAQLEDEGSYYFRIIRGGGLKFSYSPQFQYTSPHVSVTEPPWDVTIKMNINSRIPGVSSKKKDLGTKIVQEGDTIWLLCTAKSRPDPTLTWRKDGENISLPQQGKESAYEIPSATLRDAGKYECQAENEFGSAKESIQLIVQYPPRFVMFSFSQSLGKDPPLTQDFPREISSLANGSRLTIQGGDSLELLCQAHGDPPVATVWITPTLEKIQDDRLELVNLTIKDEGQYLCQADNFLGSAQGVLTLSITFSGAPNENLPANVDLLLLILLGVNKALLCFSFLLSTMSGSTQQKGPQRTKRTGQPRKDLVSTAPGHMSPVKEVVPAEKERAVISAVGASLLGLK